MTLPGGTNAGSSTVPGTPPPIPDSCWSCPSADASDPSAEPSAAGEVKLPNNCDRASPPRLPENRDAKLGTLKALREQTIGSKVDK